MSVCCTDQLAPTDTRSSLVYTRNRTHTALTRIFPSGSAPFGHAPLGRPFSSLCFFFLITRLGHDHRRQIDSLRRRPSAFNLFQIARSTQVKAKQ